MADADNMVSAATMIVECYLTVLGCNGNSNYNVIERPQIILGSIVAYTTTPQGSSMGSTWP